MRILMINPNISTSVTARIVAAAEAAKSPGTDVVGVTAQTGVSYIATRAEAAIGAMAVLDALAAHRDGADAAVIAAFGDPGLGGARELADMPVIGLAEAAMLTACMLGKRFAIVSFSTALGPWYRDCVEMHGLSQRLAAIRLLDSAVGDIDQVASDNADRLVRLCHETVDRDDADVVILAGAPLAGLAAEIADRVPVPLVDGVAAALRQAEALAGLRVRKATRGSYRRPSPKPLKGVSAALTRLYSAP